MKARTSTIKLTVNKLACGLPGKLVRVLHRPRVSYFLSKELKMIVEWYFGTGKYDGCEQIETLAQFEADHPFAAQTYQGKVSDKIVAIYESSDGSVARIYN